ncbi:MAG: hypothetical protein JWR25_2358 [Noviherbaspirillum sp.]|nr:hypothetical protein [Noviherbaspirillum sp.]
MLSDWQNLLRSGTKILVQCHSQASLAWMSPCRIIPLLMDFGYNEMWLSLFRLRREEGFVKKVTCKQKRGHP